MLDRIRKKTLLSRLNTVTITSSARAEEEDISLLTVASIAMGIQCCYNKCYALSRGYRTYSFAVLVFAVLEIIIIIIMGIVTALPTQINIQQVQAKHWCLSNGIL